MLDQLAERLKLIASPDNNALLALIQRGLEKESLRVAGDGSLAQTPHPEGLGSALTNPYITTDFSEALLEFITPVDSSIKQSLNCLDRVHRYVYSQLGDEQLWTASMPCSLPDDSEIPVAQYGSSNVATMKTVYRKGLGNRYGRMMQTISGIHYNFSLPQELWQVLQQRDQHKGSLQDYITESYFKLIRNFRRFSWLLVYLYGASPAVCNSFLKGREHQLQALDPHSVYLPYATALRMGDLGYQSSAQENMAICYNSIDNYISTLCQAITNSHTDYEAIGIKGEEGYRQLSTGLIQIENEFYSPIRPKRVTQSGETPLGALQQQGVEYIEVRCIDVNPYLPMGIDEDQIRFIDSFLLYCLFEQSPLCDDADRDRIDKNFKAVVNCGRQPELMLEAADGPKSLNNWAGELLSGIEKIAQQLDTSHGGDDYLRVCTEQQKKLADPSLTPSAKVLADMNKHQQSFFDFVKELSSQHNTDFRSRPLAEDEWAHFQQIKKQSVQKQAEIEAADTISFEQYLADYYQQYQHWS